MKARRASNPALAGLIIDGDLVDDVPETDASAEPVASLGRRARKKAAKLQRAAEAAASKAVDSGSDAISDAADAIANASASAFDLVEDAVATLTKKAKKRAAAKEKKAAKANRKSARKAAKNRRLLIFKTKKAKAEKKAKKLVRKAECALDRQLKEARSAGVATLSSWTSTSDKGSAPSLSSATNAVAQALLASAAGELASGRKKGGSKKKRPVTKLVLVAAAAGGAAVAMKKLRSSSGGTGSAAPWETVDISNTSAGASTADDSAGVADGGSTGDTSAVDSSESTGSDSSSADSGLSGLATSAGSSSEVETDADDTASPLSFAQADTGDSATGSADVTATDDNPIDLSSHAFASAASAGPDNIERIEGIGPKIAAALQDAGLNTFAEIASASADQLGSALEAANIRFAPSLPTWSEQAALLRDGDEEGFVALTDRLIAGRKPE